MMCYVCAYTPQRTAYVSRSLIMWRRQAKLCRFSKLRKYDFHNFAFQWLISSASRITPHFMEGEGSCRVDKSLLLVSVLSQIYPAYHLPSYSCKIHFNFILSTQAYISLLQISPQKFCTHSTLPQIPPFAAGLMILDLINLIIFGEERKSLGSKLHKFLRSLVTSKM